MKEYIGCVVRRPPLTHQQPHDLTLEEIREHIVGKLVGKPICYEHQTSQHIGDIRSAWQHPDGSLYISFTMRDDAYSQSIQQLISSKQVLGLSLTTYRSTIEALVPLEVSVCSTPLRPMAYIENASRKIDNGGKKQSNINPVSFTDPVSEPIVESKEMSHIVSIRNPEDKIPAGNASILAKMPDLEKRFIAFMNQEMLAASGGGDDSNLPDALRQLNPLQYQQTQQQRQAAEADQQAQLRKQQDEEILKRADAIREQQRLQQAIPPPKPPQQPPEEKKTEDPMEISSSDAGRALAVNAKRKAAETSELEEERKKFAEEREQFSKKQKEVTWGLFSEVIAAMKTNGMTDAEIEEIRAQVDNHPTPLDFLKTLRRIYPTAPPSTPRGATAMETQKPNAASVWNAHLESEKKETGKDNLFDSEESARRVIERYKQQRDKDSGMPVMPHYGLVQASATVNPKDQWQTLLQAWFDGHQQLLRGPNEVMIQNRGARERPGFWVRNAPAPKSFEQNVTDFALPQIGEGSLAYKEQYSRQHFPGLNNNAMQT